MPNIFLFTGENTFLLSEHVKLWKEEFKKKHGGDINLLSLDAESIDISEITTDIQAMPFLAEKRLIFIKNLPEKAVVSKANKEKKESERQKKANEKKDIVLSNLVKSLEDIPESTVVVFIQSKPDKRKSLYKKLVQLAELKTFDLLDPYKLEDWIKKRAEFYSSKIDSYTAKYLISKLNNNMWRLENEISKLATYAYGRDIKKEDIDKLVLPVLEASIFALTDKLSSKNYISAINNLKTLAESGENIIYVFFMIVRQLRLFLQISSYLEQYPSTSPKNLSAELGIHPFVVKNILSQLRNFTKKELEIAYKKLLQIDLELKTSVIKTTVNDSSELIMALERFIIDFCRN